MKRIYLVLLLASLAPQIRAQVSAGETKWTTEYETFQPARVIMAKGDTLEANANIFLKNSTLYYKKGAFTFAVETSKIKSVEFADKRYVQCDTALATVVSSVKDNALLAVKMIDVGTWTSRMKNAQEFTQIRLGDVMQYSTVDNSTEEDRMYPLFTYYYYRYNGEVIPVDERAIRRKLPKSKQYIFRAVTANDNFSWTSEEWLARLLKYITE